MDPFPHPLFTFPAFLSSSLDGYSVERKTGDLNDGVGSKSGYIYVYATKDRNAGDPISSLGIWNTDDRKLQYAGGNSGSGLTSENQQEVDSNWNKIDGDLNKNAGGAYIYLYCKRAPYVIPNDIRLNFAVSAVLFTPSQSPSSSFVYLS